MSLRGSLSSGLVGVGVQSVSVCVSSSGGGGGGGMWGVINEGWNVERKQTRPRRHLSFTKLARLTDFFFFFFSPLFTTTTPPDYVTRWHTHTRALMCTHIKSQRTHFFFFFSPSSPPLSFFLSLNMEHRALEFTLSSIFVPPLLCIMYPSARLLLRNGGCLNLG